MQHGRPLFSKVLMFEQEHHTYEEAILHCDEKNQTLCEFRTGIESDILIGDSDVGGIDVWHPYSTSVANIDVSETDLDLYLPF